MWRNIGRAFGLAFGLSAMVSACGLAHAQDAAPAAQPPAQAGEPALDTVRTGTLVFERETIDLGTIVQNEIKEIKYSFENKTALPVTIKELKRSCGCTEAKVHIVGGDKFAEPKESDANSWFVVPAGAKCEIAATFDPKGKSGTQSKTVTVISDDDERGEIILTFTVMVEQNIMIEPTILNFGTIERGASKVLKLTVVGRTPDFAATDATVTLGELFDIKKGETREVERGGKKLRATEFEITLKANTKSGRGNDTLNVRTSDKNEPLKPVSITYMIQGLLASEPNVLALSSAQPGGEMKGEIIIKHRKDQPFKILKVEAAVAAGNAKPTLPDPEITFQFEPVDAATPNKWRIKAVCIAPMDRPSVNVVAKITTDVAGEEMIQTRAYGVVRRNQAAANPPAQAPAPAGAPARDPATNK
ncbi:MAG: DUF1573 domain-containing protein [Phycisphaerales bacterium]|nr:DUF1573 domain-containing protein [Phycisphaerales bacterium]